MPRRLILAGSLVVALVAAACREAPRPAGADPERRAACKELFTQSVGGVHMMMESLPELRREQVKIYRRGGLRECLSRLPDMPGACLESEVPAQLLVDLEAAVNLCSGWDDELFGCFQDPRQDARCTRAYDRLRGLASATALLPGPPPRWHLELPAPAQAVHLLADGTVLSVAGGQVAAHRDGRQLWAADVPGGALGWLMPIEPQGVVVGDRQGQVALLDLATGKIRWRRELPYRMRPRPEEAPELDEKVPLPGELRQAGLRAGGSPEEVPHPLALSAAREREQLLLGVSDGRVLRLDLQVCAERDTGCFRAPERMFVEDLGSFRTWPVLPDGRRLVPLAQELVGIERTGEERFRISLDPYDRLSPPTAAADGTFVLAGVYGTSDGRVLALDPDACRSDGIVDLPPPASQREDLEEQANHEGHMDHEGHAHEEPAFPEGCLAWEVELLNLASLPPLDLGPEGGVIVLESTEGLVVCVRRGEVRWRTRIDAVAATAGPDGRAYVLGGAPAVVALDTRNGQPLWQSRLPYPHRPDFTEVWPTLTLRGRLLLVSDGPQLTLLELPAPAEARP